MRLQIVPEAGTSTREKQQQREQNLGPRSRHRAKPSTTDWNGKLGSTDTSEISRFRLEEFRRGRKGRFRDQEWLSEGRVSSLLQADFEEPSASPRHPPASPSAETINALTHIADSMAQSAWDSRAPRQPAWSGPKRSDSDDTALRGVVVRIRPLPDSKGVIQRGAQRIVQAFGGRSRVPGEICNDQVRRGDRQAVGSETDPEIR